MTGFAPTGTPVCSSLPTPRGYPGYHAPVAADAALDACARAMAAGHGPLDDRLRAAIVAANEVLMALPADAPWGRCSFTAAEPALQGARCELADVGVAGVEQRGHGSVPRGGDVLRAQRTRREAAQLRLAALFDTS